jgi:hypothetical protein
MPIGRETFKKINAGIHVDDGTVDDLEAKLCGILGKTFRSLVAPNNVWAFDELMFPHNTLNDPLIAFLPRKLCRLVNAHPGLPPAGRYPDKRQPRGALTVTALPRGR